jgi:hypothetical protein
MQESCIINISKYYKNNLLYLLIFILVCNHANFEDRNSIETKYHNEIVNECFPYICSINRKEPIIDSGMYQKLL